MKTRVLLVDDHKIMCEGLRLLLQKQPDFVVVALAYNKSDGVKRALETSPEIVIMDIDLAGESGIDAAREILEKLPDTRVIFLSAVIDPDSVNQALKIGCNGYVLKSRAFNELAHAIHEVLGGHRYFCPEVSDAVFANYQRMLGTPGQAGSVERAPISEREIEVLKLTAEGLRVKEIAATLDISIKTVDTHRSNLMKKLNCSSAADLTRYAIREGLVKL